MYDFIAILFMIMFFIHISVVRKSEAENGRDAETQHVMDWGAVSQEGRGCALSL